MYNVNIDNLMIELTMEYLYENKDNHHIWLNRRSEKFAEQYMLSLLVRYLRDPLQ